MPTLHRHKHCQAAQTNAQTQAWQRVCLPKCTTKTHDKQADEKEHRSDNRRLAKEAIQCSADSFVVNESLVFQIKFCGKSPALRVAAKRWW